MTRRHNIYLNTYRHNWTTLLKSIELIRYGIETIFSMRGYNVSTNENYIFIVFLLAILILQRFNVTPFSSSSPSSFTHITKFCVRKSLHRPFLFVARDFICNLCVFEFVYNLICHVSNYLRDFVWVITNHLIRILEMLCVENDDETIRHFGHLFIFYIYKKKRKFHQWKMIENHCVHTQ